VTTTAELLAEKRRDYCALDTEIAALEQRLIDEAQITIGTYAIVTEPIWACDYLAGSVVIVRSMVRTLAEVRSPLVAASAWVSIDKLRRVDAEEARGTLHKQIEALFASEGAVINGKI
jgi:hypothetical protein